MKRSRALVAFALAFIVLSSSLTFNVSLADSAPHGVISLTFDDGWQNQYSNAFPLMQARGITGTFYVVTGELRDFSGDSSFMSIAELKSMQNYGCEIGSHSATHPDFTTLTDDQIRQECQNSQTVLQSNGLSGINFAYPYGSYNGHTDSIVSQYYRTGRDVYNPDVVLQLPYTQFHLPGDQGDGGDPGVLSNLKSIVDQVYSTNEWGVIYFHQIIPNVPNSLEVINTQTFTSFLNYINSKGVPTLTVNQALNLVSSPVPPPSVTISPTSVRMYPGQSRTFSSSVSGGNPSFSYQWYLNNTAVSGANSNTWTFTPSSTGNYKVYLNVTDALRFQVQSNIVTDISVHSLPSVTISPASTNMTFGTTQTFTSSVAGVSNATDTIGSAATDSTENDAAINANQLTPTASGTSLTVGINVKTPAGKISAAIYNDNNGQPGSLLGTSTSQTATPGWNDLTVSNVNIQAGTPIWLAFQTDNANCDIYYSTTGGTLYYTLQTYGSYPTSPQWVDDITWVFNMRVTYNATTTSGFAPYTYQWYYANGIAIAGATASTLAYKANSTGVFNIYLNLTDNLNTVAKSNTATITVYSQPSATINPTAVSMTVGTTQTFTSTASGGLGPYTYQWYYTNGTAIIGATTSTLSYKANSTGTASIYLKVTDSLNAIAQSNTATITVYSQPSATINPTTVKMTVGTTQQFTSTVTGGLAPYTYQWYQNDTAVSGATSNTWNFTPATTGHYKVYLKATDSLSYQVQSNIVTDITVNPQATATINPTSVNMTVGTTQTFSGTVTGGTTPYFYQWYQNNAAVPGANSNTWDFKPAATGTYNIYLNVTDNSAVTVKSNTATITVYSQPTTTINPTTVQMTVGTTQTFTSTASGGLAPYTYQWYYNNGTAITGATTSTLAYKANQTGTQNIYLKIADSLNAIAQSNTATITVYSRPSATIAPTSVQMTVGSTRQFTSTVTGGLTPYTYQWYLNDSAVSGATSNTWNFNPTVVGHFKVYLSVTDALNFNAQSNIVTDITVNPQATATINPTNPNMTVGGAQTFSSIVSGGTTPYSYQWYTNNAAVSGATNPNWTFMPTSAGTYNIYLNVTDNSAVTVKSNSATAIVETPMTVNITPAQTKMYTGQTQTFSSSVSGGTSPYTYQWYLNDSAVPGATGSTWTFTPKTTGHYKVYLTVTDALSFTVQSNINNVLVCSVYLLLTTDPAQGSYSSGKSVTFTVKVFNQWDPSLESSLTLTVTGPGSYSYFDVQPISAPAGTVLEYTFVWVVPNVAGRYIVEVGLAPAQLTAYDNAWLNVK